MGACKSKVRATPAAAGGGAPPTDAPAAATEDVDWDALRADVLALMDSDAYDDDLPRIVPNTATGGQHEIVPYSLDTNDMRYQLPAAGFPTATHFADCCIDAIDCLWEEGQNDAGKSNGRPKMMSIGLHPRVIGRPGRIAGLERVLAHCRKKGGVWFARRDEIAKHWLAEHGGERS